MARTGLPPNYTYQALASRLESARLNSFDGYTQSAQKRFRADRRSYGAHAHITVDHNTTAEYGSMDPITGKLSIVIRLHGHTIGNIYPHGVRFRLDHGWHTMTTLGRMRDILRTVAPLFSLTTRNGTGGRPRVFGDLYLATYQPGTPAHPAPAYEWLLRHPGHRLLVTADPDTPTRFSPIPIGAELLVSAADAPFYVPTEPSPDSPPAHPTPAGAHHGQAPRP